MNRAPFHSFAIERETQEEQREAGRYNPADVITWGGLRYSLGCGTADDVDVFTEHGALYVLSRNRGLGYAGLQVFRDGDEIASVWIDSDERGQYINDLTAVYAAKRMANWGCCEGGYAAC
jgi:hypothetical protein